METPFEKYLNALLIWISKNDSLSVFMNEGINIRKSPEEIGNAFKVIFDRMKKEKNATNNRNMP